MKAIGERAIIDFPDSVNFGSCPVKDMTTKTLFVRNIGKREAKFSLSLSRYTWYCILLTVLVTMLCIERTVAPDFVRNLL